ncbi:uncharacterized protein LOC116603578 isoform X3 [Nematostella vectensis]|uniref:uncharacterized protein LOC116603578 isoform X3 n=1 Tax=Nematostella vectensis TaxID=45351 RepID=UPI00207780AF|nr:uncharacterized protein LOC116603578 isoform X3 [Nematostella vectensis]XP_048580968.1 uncharacterized protein LOC116603578 isoform X3 [Nematostella vectensis]
MSLQTHEVVSLTCWMCAGGSGDSFEDCNTRKVVESCARYPERGGETAERCAYFSYVSDITGKLVYAKSCTYPSYCKRTGNEFQTFCDNVKDGASRCNVECCTTDNCNDRVQFVNVSGGTPVDGEGDWCEWLESGSDGAFPYMAFICIMTLAMYKFF